MSGFTAEQLEARRETLGASELPAILGVSPYKGAFEVWLEKRGLSEPRSDDTPWQAWGLKMEPVIAESYQEAMLKEHGQLLTLSGDGRTSIRMTDTPWSCTPDRMVDWIAGGETWGVDFKQTRYGEGYGPAWSEEVPAHVYAQCQWSMFVTDRGRWDVACLIGGSDFRVYHLMRNDEFLDAALAEAEAFWRHVVDGTEPPMDASRGAKQYLLARFPEDVAMDPLPVYDDVETTNLMAELEAVRVEGKRLSVKQTTLENQLKLLIADRPGLVTPVGRATWKRTKDSTVVDWQGLVEQYVPDPKLWEPFTSTKPGTRRFLFKSSHPREEDA